jgi:hypothetical protein
MLTLLYLCPLATPARGFKQLQSRDLGRLNAAQQRAVLPRNECNFSELVLPPSKREARGAIDFILSWSISALLQLWIEFSG